MRVYQVKGQIKTRARDGVVAAYKLNPSSSTDVNLVNANRALIEMLKDRSAFVYQVRKLPLIVHPIANVHVNLSRIPPTAIWAVHCIARVSSPKCFARSGIVINPNRRPSRFLSHSLEAFR